MSGKLRFYVVFAAFYTTEEQIYELFSRCGDIRRIVMGLDKFKKVKCTRIVN